MFERKGASGNVIVGYAAQETDFFASREGGEVVEKDEACGEWGAAHHSRDGVAL